MRTNTEKLIIDGHKFSSQYKNGFSNHLPMVLYALDDIGAKDEKISSFYENYSKKLEQCKQAKDEPITRNIEIHLSNPYLFLNFVELFKNELKENGIDFVLNEYFPLLFQGVSGGAFHPLIRLAFALEIENNDEVAYALASWAIAYQKLEGKEKSSSNSSLLESLLFLQKNSAFYGYKPEGYGVFRRMEAASRHEGFKGFFNSFESNENSLSEMAEICIKLYLSSNDNFTALHAVTSCHAMRVVMENIEIKRDLLQHYWHAIGAAFVDVGMPILLNDFDTKNLPSWNEIQSKACESSNDHLIKLVYTCKKEFQYYKNPFYQLAATLKVSLL